MSSAKPNTTPANDTVKQTDAEKQGLLFENANALRDAGKIAALIKAFGTPALPYPMFGTMDVVDEDGQKHKEQALSVIKSKESPLTIVSEKNFDEVWGILAREMPTPSMLPIFREMLTRMFIHPTDPQGDSKNRQFLVMGDPGMGKSFMGGMIGRLMTRKAPKVYDCGGKQMNSMLFEMVLDFGNGEGPGAALDAKMQAGRLCSQSILLMDLLDKKYDIITKVSEGKYQIDWAAARGGEIGDKNVRELRDTLNEVIKLEGLDKGGQNMLGMSSQFGPAIEDFRKGRFSTWDEYNKSKQGGDDMLQTFLQFVNGETDTCTVENPLKGKDGTSGPSKFTFRREDVKPGWGILFTGNKTKDGATTRELNQSVYSRLGPRDLPEVNARDWQHRICQLMTGVPVSTWYEVYKDVADENPEAFADFLWDIRTAGLTQKQIDAIPPQHRTWLQNWERVVTASKDLGEFYHGWRERMDPDKADVEFHLDDEVDATFSKEQSLDFRRVIKILQKAERPRAKLAPLGSKNVLPSKDVMKNGATDFDLDNSSRDMGEDYGTRLVDLIITDIFESSGAINKKALFESLMTLAAECNLVEKHLDDAARSNVKTVEDNLNISRFDSADIKIQAKLAQETFCNMLREKHPEITVPDNEIVTLDRMASIIQNMRAQEKKAREENSLTLPNSDVDTLAEQPFFEAKLYDYASSSILKNYDEEPYLDQILTSEEFMEAFVLPGVKSKNLEAVWEDNLTLRKVYGDIQNDIEEVDGNIQDRKDVLENAQDELNAKKDRQARLSNEDSKAIEDLQKSIKDSETKIDELKKSIEVMETEKKDLLTRLNNIENGDLSALKRSVDANDNTPDANIEADAFDIAESRTKSGLGFTTVACRVEDDVEDENDTSFKMKNVHILRKADKALVIGGTISKSLKEAFDRAKVKYVDYDQENAARKISDAIAEFTQGVSKDEIDTLTDVFSFRNKRSLGTDKKLADYIVENREFKQDSGNRKEVFYKFYYKPDAA